MVGYVRPCQCKGQNPHNNLRHSESGYAIPVQLLGAQRSPAEEPEETDEDLADLYG